MNKKTYHKSFFKEGPMISRQSLVLGFAFLFGAASIANAQYNSFEDECFFEDSVNGKECTCELDDQDLTHADRVIAMFDADGTKYNCSNLQQHEEDGDDDADFGDDDGDDGGGGDDDNGGGNDHTNDQTGTPDF